MVYVLPLPPGHDREVLLGEATGALEVVETPVDEHVVTVTVVKPEAGVAEVEDPIADEAVVEEEPMINCPPMMLPL